MRSILNNDNDRKYLFTPAEDLQKFQPSFAVYQLSIFKGCVIILKNEAMRMNKSWSKTWDKSEAMKHTKTLLLEDFDGTYQAMDVKTFMKISPLFKQYPLDYLERYLGKFLKKMAKNNEIVKFDEACLRHDRLVISPKMTTKNDAPQWDRHPVRKFLKQDIAAGKHKK